MLNSKLLLSTIALKIHVRDGKRRITCALSHHGAIFNKTGINTKLPIKVTPSGTNTITRTMVTIYGSGPKGRSNLNEIFSRIIEIQFDKLKSNFITSIKTICDLLPKCCELKSNRAMCYCNRIHLYHH